jgi:hypothetical protein
MFCFLTKILTNPSISLYFYSAVFQGNMAILALSAVFVVFYLQELSGLIAKEEDLIISYVNDYIKNQCTYPHKTFSIYRKFVRAHANNILKLLKKYSIETSYDNKEKFQVFIKACNELIIDRTLIKYHSDLKVIIRKKKKVIEKLETPFYWILSVLIISIFLLPLSYCIHNIRIHNIPFFVLILIIFVVYLNIRALYQTTKFIFNVLQENIGQNVKDEKIIDFFIKIIKIPFRRKNK